MSSVAFGFYYLQKLQVFTYWQHFHVEDRVCLEAKVAKIWLKFEAAQATCRDDDDDDDHISSSIDSRPTRKQLLRRMEPPLLMRVFNDLTQLYRNGAMQGQWRKAVFVGPCSSSAGNSEFRAKPSHGSCGDIFLAAQLNINSKS